MFLAYGVAPFVGVLLIIAAIAAAAALYNLGYHNGRVKGYRDGRFVLVIVKDTLRSIIRDDGDTGIGANL